jgi:Zn-dependent peptidase ImmA (M78 family)/DNA-binding transcriptional regulator YiaG
MSDLFGDLVRQRAGVRGRAEPVAGIQPSVLRWARESRGYSVEEAAIHIKRSADEIMAWESGEAAPTYAQLEKLAYTVYKRPLAVFFLPAPPAEPNVKQEFRTLPDSELDQLLPDTLYQLRLARAFQLSLRELNDGVNPAQRKVFRDIDFPSGINPQEAASSLREYLRISLDTQISWASDDDALKAWRNAVEETGVFVFKHAFKQKSISSFCLVEDEFPLIYLNNSTTKTRQIFSLFHELAHLLLHVNSISMVNDAYIEALPRKQKRIEQFCNAFTAEFLVPSDDFSEQIKRVHSFEDETVKGLAKRYYVSREAVLRRLLDLGLVTRDYYMAQAKRWADEKKSGGTGGDYFATQASYLGEHYMQLVFGKHYQGKLTLEQVAEYLGVKTKSVADLEMLLLRKGAPA